MGRRHVKPQRALDKARQVVLEAEQEKNRNRISQAVQQFLAGDRDLLNRREVASALGPHLVHCYQTGQRQTVHDALAALGSLVCDGDQDLREKAVDALSKCSAALEQYNDFEVSLRIYKPLVAWMSCEETYISGFGIACSQLHKLAQKVLSNKKYWPEAEPLLITLHHIQEGVVDRNSSIRGMAVKLLESLATKQLLDSLATCYLQERANLRYSAETIITNLGRRSVVYLLNRLMHSQSKDERLQLIKLIPGTGNVAVPVLSECLDKKPPWYVIRNIVFVISELNNGSLYNIVRPYLSHPDIRVQQQVLSCMVKISGGKLQRRLIEALPLVHDELKMQIIMQLSQIGGGEVVSALLDLLGSRDSLNRETYIELLVKICVAFKFSSSKEVIPALNELIDERQKHAGPSDPVIVTARDTLLVLEPRYRHQSQAVGGDIDSVESEYRFVSETDMAGSLRRIERSVKELVAQGDLERAGQKLFANAVTAARDKDFASAELLRDKMLEINPLALSEVIRLGEIIEEEKSSSLSNHHIAVWSELYEQMTTEEFNALYFAMKQEIYQVDEALVREGETDPSLYFVNAGIIRMSCQSGGRETFLKRLRPGEVIGVAQFFSASVWTVSLAAQTETQVHVLSRENYETLTATYPDLAAKLFAFCNKYDTVPELLKMAGSDRREYPRYGVNIFINNLLLDPYGNAGKRKFKGELADISRGGLCFTVHITSRENARLLLGRQIVSEMHVADGTVLKCFGVIVGVQSHRDNDQHFSVHVRFYRNMEQQDVTRIVNLDI